MLYKKKQVNKRPRRRKGKRYTKRDKLELNNGKKTNNLSVKKREMIKITTTYYKNKLLNW